MTRNLAPKFFLPKNEVKCYLNTVAKYYSFSSFILPPKNPIEIMAGKVSRDAMTQMLTV